MNVMMLQERNFNKILLTALLVGAVSSAFAWTSLGAGTNLEYEIDGTVLRRQSPDPASDAAIPGEVFAGNTTITSVSLPSNVTTIEGQAFMGCTALANVDLGNVQEIISYAFSGCTALQEIVIPSSVESIGGHAFYGCSSLALVKCRPVAPPTLGTDAFTNCAGGLDICVVNDSSYGPYRGASGWSDYADKISDCSCNCFRVVIE